MQPHSSDSGVTDHAMGDGLRAMAEAGIVVDGGPPQGPKTESPTTIAIAIGVVLAIVFLPIFLFVRRARLRRTNGDGTKKNK